MDCKDWSCLDRVQISVEGIVGSAQYQQFDLEERIGKDGDFKSCLDRVQISLMHQQFDREEEIGKDGDFKCCLDRVQISLMYQQFDLEERIGKDGDFKCFQFPTKRFNDRVRQNEKQRRRR